MKRRSFFAAVASVFSFPFFTRAAPAPKGAKTTGERLIERLDKLSRKLHDGKKADLFTRAQLLIDLEPSFTIWLQDKNGESLSSYHLPTLEAAFVDIEQQVEDRLKNWQ